MTVAIVDYGSGNLRSVAKACERVLKEAGRGDTVHVTADPDVVAAADRVILPGVGAFGDCRTGLLALDGMTEALEDFAITQAKPFLGICVGMQLMADQGHEFGLHPGFGWIPGEVMALRPNDDSLKIPHMGWNTLRVSEVGHPVLRGIEGGQHAYFVHSYQFVAEDPRHLLASVDYGGPVTAAIGRDNLVGTQFHPEKSQAVGLRLLRNFMEWKT